MLKSSKMKTSKKKTLNLGIEAVAVHPDGGEEAHSLALLAETLVNTRSQNGNGQERESRHN